ncbi:MAG TPA: LuxR C-terminal-related transcriptional regulator [Roseiflexaceae bacterium]|nr:LuxR C-terminal-related transcriptional regulator [Roseiflexaceae bacterium]
MSFADHYPFFTLRLTQTQLQRLVAGEVITLMVVLDGSGVAQADATEHLYAALRARGLSARQTELVLLDHQGFTRTEIVQRLGLSPRTVDWHWRTINARLGVANRAGLRALVRSILAAPSETSFPLADEP